MRSVWVHLLLLTTFAYWATGAAKFVHETVEHHGGPTVGVVDDDEDGCDAGARPAVVAALGDPHHQPIHHSHPCPVCQTLAAMTADRPATAIVPMPALSVVATLVSTGRVPPIVRSAFTRLTTGPPAATIGLS